MRQEVWTELLKRLPAFRLDAGRGKFDTWLFNIVRGKTVNIHRAHKRRLLQDESDTLRTAIDSHPSPAQGLEKAEMFALAWDELRKRLSECNLQILQMRLVEDRSVAEVAEKLGLTHKQVWYRYHRAFRQMEAIGPALANGQCLRSSSDCSPCEQIEKKQDSAQGKQASCVPRNVRFSSITGPGGNSVDHVFQRVELGRRELTPEWKVESKCDAEPKPVLYLRKTATVAYAEICGPADFISTHWPRIVNAAIAAGVAAGIATIISTPTAALPIFQAEFQKHFPGKGNGTAEEKIHVALSAKQEANGPWCVCKE